MLSIKIILLGISPFWKWWSVYMVSLVVIYLVGVIIEENKKTTTKSKKINFKKGYSLNVAKARFVNLVIEWCQKNMEFPAHHKYYPTVEIKYYKSKKKSGDYSSRSRVIRIFVNNRQTIEELVDTCIHEYAHYLQMPKEINQLEYTKYNKTKGYYNNPYEVDARKKAAFYTPKCVKDLRKLGYIS